MNDELQHDVIVIGAGPAGEVVAGRCADAGLNVAVIEKELVGGECSYWGCIPSKTLIRPGDVLAAARRVPGAREAVVGDLDATAAFAQRDYMTSNWNDKGAVDWLDSEGIALYRGRGRLAGNRLVEVERTDQPLVRLQAGRAVVLATGTGAFIPPVPGLGEAAPWTNREATAAKQVPPSLLVMGGGAVGVELAQGFARLGSKVTIVESSPHLLAREEPFAGVQVREAFEAEGIVVLTSSRVVEVSRPNTDGPLSVSVDPGAAIEVDQILVATGRRPATGDLGLESVDLAPGAAIPVDDLFRVKGSEGPIDWLYAIGDCNGTAPLTHMGKYQGRVVSDVIAGRTVAPTKQVIPRVTFTDPQVCAVGMIETDARAAGFEVDVVSYGTGDVAGAYTQGEGITGTSQLVINRESGTLLGATFTGPGVQELLHSATIAIVAEVPLELLWHAVPSFPTVSEVWLRLLEAYGL